jgi:hypothetical protein
MCLLYLATVESVGPNAVKYVFRAGLCFALFLSYRGFKDARDYGNWFRGYLLDSAAVWEAGQPVESFHHPEEATRMLNTLAGENRYEAPPPRAKKP